MFFPQILVLPLGEVEDLSILLDAMVLGLEVGEHGPVYPRGVRSQVEIDDQSKEPYLEPSPFAHWFLQDVIKTLHFILFSFFNFIFTKKRLKDWII